MTAARYDAIADFYSESFSAVDGVLTTLLDLLGPVDGRPVLDLACGHGRATRELAARGAQVTGVELSAEMLARAAPGIRYHQGDVATREWLGDERFDAVVCSFALSDIDDLDGVLTTVETALRPGGVFAFSILHPCFPGAGEVSGAWPSDGRYYDEGWWRAAGARSGLRREVGANHRMLSTYVNALVRHGLTIEEMREPEPAPEWVTGREEAARYPLYLVMRCRS
jgi:SAM-dependent methyltransferase